MSLIQTVKATIGKHDMLSPGSHVLVGVSGGSDSVALLYLLRDLKKKLGIKISVANLDHGIRGVSSRKDSDFVASLARKLRIKCVCGKARVPIRARNAGISLEMAAREARYEFFKRTAKQLGADCVATAHTYDDQAETVLLKLVRGAGSGGLAGVQYVSDLNGLRVIRPLLDIRKVDLVKYLQDRSSVWREDESNSELSFLRNRIRHEVIPLLEDRLNPGVSSALVRAADILRHEDEWLSSMSAELVRNGLDEDGSLCFAFLLTQPLAARRRAVRTWLVSQGLRPEQVTYAMADSVEGLMHKRGGAGVDIGQGWRVKRHRDSLVLASGRELVASFRSVVKREGDTIVESAGLIVSASIEKGIIREKPLGAGVLPSSASIGLKAIGRRRIVVRSWREGDRMKPMGMTGTRKLKSIFIDAKVPQHLRSGVPLFECAGEIIWLPGYRVARGWEVKPGESSALHLHVALL